MDDLTQALKGQPKGVQVAGVSCQLRRPTVLDAIALSDRIAKHPGEEAQTGAWLLSRHLERDGKPVFESLEAVMACDWATLRPLIEQVQALYSEGGN